MNDIPQRTYNFVQKSSATQPVPLFSFPQPAALPSPAFTSVMVNTPFPVYSPVYA